MSQVFLLLRHGAYFGVALALPLGLLALMVALVAWRRQIQAITWRPALAARFCAWCAVSGIAGQLLFSVLASLGASPLLARSLGFALAAGAIGWICPTVIAFFCRWKGVALGVGAALPAAWLYNALAPNDDSIARVAVAALLAGLLALAVTLPLPAERITPAFGKWQVSSWDGVPPTAGRMGADFFVQPKESLIVPDGASMPPRRLGWIFKMLPRWGRHSKSRS